MVLIGLLLAALVCIVIGVVFASGPWFVGSLIASALAGYFLYRQRDQISGRGDNGGTGGTASTSADSPTGQPAPSRQTALVTGTAFQKNKSDSAATPGSSTSANDTSANDTSATAASAASAAGPARTPVVELPADTTVWVVDGEPQFHAEACGRIAALSPEVIPYEQAVADGFTECSACTPVAAARQPAAAPAAVDHADARDATGPDATDERQATDRADAGGDSTVGDGDEVWVVDGRPRFHLRDCLSIKDQPAEPIPLDQATEDGFIPCTMCEPTVSRV